jgi:hypothetical protein
MLPEILRYEPTRPASFPDNGRTLIDDAIDALLPILTKSRSVSAIFVFGAIQLDAFEERGEERKRYGDEQGNWHHQ